MPRVAAADEGQGVGAVDGPGHRAPDPAQLVGVKSVIPGHRERDRPQSVIPLDAAIDGIFLVPEESALDVHVLERKRVLRTDERRQLAAHDRKIFCWRDLEKALRKRSEEIVRRRPGVNIPHPEGRQRVRAGLREKLHDAIRWRTDGDRTGDNAHSEPVTPTSGHRHQEPPCGDRFGRPDLAITGCHTHAWKTREPAYSDEYMLNI